MAHQQPNLAAVASTSGDSTPSIEAIFEDAQSDLYAAFNVVDFAVKEGHAGEAIDDLCGQLALPVKILLENSLNQFEALGKACKLPAAEARAIGLPKLDALQTEATLPLLAALSVANFADAHDADGGGGLMFPVQRLLTESVRKFDVLQAALARAQKGAA